MSGQNMYNKVIENKNPNGFTLYREFPCKIYVNGKKIRPKQQALSYLATLPTTTSTESTNYKLFSHDIPERPGDKPGAKKFIVATRDEIYEKSVGKFVSFYENFEKGDRVKLFIDMDIPAELVGERKRDDVLKDYVAAVVMFIKTILPIVKPSYVVLKSENIKGKLSAHIIFMNIVFRPIQSQH